MEETARVTAEIAEPHDRVLIPDQAGVDHQRETFGSKKQISDQIKREDNAEAEVPGHKHFASGIFTIGEVDDCTGDHERKPENGIEAVKHLVGDMKSQDAVIAVGHVGIPPLVMGQSQLRALGVVSVQQTVHGVVHGGGLKIHVDLAHNGIFVRTRQVHLLAKLVVFVKTFLTGKQNGVAVSNQVVDCPTGRAGSNRAQAHDLEQTAAAKDNAGRAFFELIVSRHDSILLG